MARQVLDITNRSIYPLHVISEVEEFNKIVIPSGAVYTFGAELPDDLKIFSRKVIKGKKTMVWVGVIDKDF